MEPIRIAQVVGKMVNGGVEAVVMNYYRHIDRNKVQFDFIVDEDSTYVRRDEIESLGGRIYIVPPYQKLSNYIPVLINIFKKNHYKIVHSHINTLSIFPLYAAKKAGVPVRIAHNHSTAAPGEWKKNIMKYTLRPFAKVYATHYAACSKYAGRWLFGKTSMECGDITIFNNAIDIEKFKFNPEMREKVRIKLQLEDKFVIGHVGRFCYAKNHEYLIDIFEEVCKLCPNACLMLVGDGEERERIEKKIKNIGKGKVIVLGNRSDTHELYQAMDIFVLPSKIEGFPVVGVEAQAAGLPCVLSDKITEEAKITDKTTMLSIDKGTKIWCDTILSYMKMERSDDSKQVKSAGYDITEKARHLETYYQSLLLNMQ